jgi:hypothetical protein
MIRKKQTKKIKKGGEGLNRVADRRQMLELN